MAMAYFFATVPRSLEEVRTILYVVVAAGTFVAVCAPLLPGSSRALGPTLGGKTVATPFGDANLNVIGYALGAPAAVALGLTVGTERAQTRFWFGAASVICALGLVLTKSRGAWLGFSAAFLYVMVRRRSLTLVVTASSVGLAVFLSDLLRALLISRASATTASDPSLLGRYLLWDYAWRIGRENWLLGVGMENFRYVKHLYGFPERLSETIKYNTHNIFLEVFVDLGVVGLAAFSWLLLSSFSKASRATDVPKARDLGLGLSAGLVAYVAHGLVDCVLFRQSVFALLGLLVGLSICTSRLVSSGRVSTVTT